MPSAGADSPRTCERCRRRPAGAAGRPRHCVACAKELAAQARQKRDSRARARARALAPPDEIVLDRTAALGLLAAVRTLDAARDRVEVVNALAARDGTPEWAAQSAPDAVAALVEMADAYDTALRLLDKALPAGVLPARNRPRAPVHHLLRTALLRLGTTAGGPATEPASPAG